MLAEQLGEWSCHLLRRKRQRSRFEGGNQVIRHINLEMPLQLQSGDNKRVSYQEGGQR